MKARNPGNTVAATNPVFDLLMTLDLLQPLLLNKRFYTFIYFNTLACRLYMVRACFGVIL